MLQTGLIFEMSQTLRYKLLPFQDPFPFWNLQVTRDLLFWFITVVLSFCGFLMKLRE